MRNYFIACAFVAGLSACAAPQPTNPQITYDQDGHARVACPPGMGQYCANVDTRNKLAAARVDYARKMLEIEQASYAKTPDAEHAARLEEAKARLNAAVQQQTY